MIADKATVSHERIVELFTYDKDTGIFIRNIASGTGKANSIAGHCDTKKYLIVGIDGRNYLLHRLAWFYVHGEWPKGQIDHINGNKQDNRIANLRDVSASVNLQNNMRPQKCNTTGFRGVSKFRDKYRAFITHRREIIYLGTFQTPEEAHVAYVSAKRSLHPHTYGLNGELL